MVMRERQRQTERQRERVVPVKTKEGGFLQEISKDGKPASEKCKEVVAT